MSLINRVFARFYKKPPTVHCASKQIAVFAACVHMFSLLSGRRAEPAPEVRAAELAARQQLFTELSAMQLAPNGSKMLDVVQLVVILHQLNIDSRSVLYRALIADGDSFAALYEARPELGYWGVRDDNSALLLPAEFWVRFFGVVRLLPWTTDEEMQRVVLKRDFRMLQSPGDRERFRAERDTSDFVRFKSGLCAALYSDMRTPLGPSADCTLLLRDMLLLYFVHCALMGKNGRAVLDSAHFNYLRAEQRDAVWRYMKQNDAHLERPRVSDKDFEERVAPPRRAWRWLLTMLDESALQQTYLSCAKESAAATQTGPPVVPRTDVLPPPVPARTDDFPAPASEEEPEQQPAATGTDDETPAVPEEEAQASADARIGAPLCRYHELALDHHDAPCPSACVQKRVGAQRASQPHWRAINTRVVDEQRYAGAKPAKAVVSLLGAALMPDAPRAREHILRQLDAPVRTTRRCNNTAEWCDLVQSFAHIDAPLPGAEHVQQMAAACGWSHLSPAQQVQRYATAYGAPDRQQAWRAQGWPAEPRVDRWLRRQPRVPIRTAQTLLWAL